jgi:hypothetical protein
VKHSINEGLQMLERFEVFARETTDALYQVSLKEAIQNARGHLKEKATLGSYD